MSDHISEKKRDNLPVGSNPAGTTLKLAGVKLADANLTSVKSTAATKADTNNAEPSAKDSLAKEYGGQKGLEPTRFGDWEKNGRCTDF